MGKTHSSPQPFWHQGPGSWKTGFLEPGGVGVGWFQDYSSALHSLCTLFLLLLHQLQLRSSGIGSWRLGTPEGPLKGPPLSYAEVGLS